MFSKINKSKKLIYYFRLKFTLILTSTACGKIILVRSSEMIRCVLENNRKYASTRILNRYAIFYYSSMHDNHCSKQVNLYDDIFIIFFIFCTLLMKI